MSSPVKKKDTKPHPYPARPRLRKARKDQNLSIYQLGERAGIDGTLISKIETGARPVKVSQLEAMARVLGCSTAHLLEDGPPMEADPGLLSGRISREVMIKAIALVEIMLRKSQKSLPDDLKANFIYKVCQHWEENGEPSPETLRAMLSMIDA